MPIATQAVSHTPSSKELTLANDEDSFVLLVPFAHVSSAKGEKGTLQLNAANHPWHATFLETKPEKVVLDKGHVEVSFDLDILEPFAADAKLFATLLASGSVSSQVPIGKFFDQRLDPDGSNTFHIHSVGRFSHRLRLGTSPDFGMCLGGGFKVALGLTNSTYKTHTQGRLRIKNFRVQFLASELPDTLPSPKLLAPEDGQELDPVSLHFLWCDADYYSSFDIEFTSEALPERTIVERIPSLGARAAAYVACEQYPPGEYMWRVRAIDRQGRVSAWSKPGLFSVRAAKPQTETRLTLSPSRPFFFIMTRDDVEEGQGTSETYAKFRKGYPLLGIDRMRWLWKSIPPSLRSQTAFEVIFSTSGQQRAWAKAFHEEWQKNPGEMPNVVILARLFNDVWNGNYGTLALSDMEWLYTQDFPWFKGISVVEQHIEWGGWSQEYLKRSLALASKYGGHVFWAEFGPQHVLNNQIAVDLLETLQNYRNHVTLLHKCNSGIAPMLMMNQIFGQWYLGNVGNLGISAEAWYFNSGYFSPEPLGGGPGTGDKTNVSLYQTLYPAFPPTFWGVQMYLGAAQGAVAYRLEPTDYQPEPVGTYKGDFWDAALRENSTFTGTILPSMKFLASNPIIPSRKEVLARVKAIAIDDNAFPYDWNNPLGPLGQFLSVAPGFHYPYQMVPNSGRYYFIPTIFGDTIKKTDFILNDQKLRIFDKKDAENLETLRDTLNTLYPEDSRGTASVLRIGSRWFIFNSWENEDKLQDFTIPFAEDYLVKDIQGTINPQGYIVGFSTPEGSRLQINGLPGRCTTLLLRTTANTPIVAEPSASLTETAWQTDSGLLKLVVCHSHGAVNITIGSPSSETPATEDGDSARSHATMRLRDFRAEPIAQLEDGLVLRFITLRGRTLQPYLDSELGSLQIDPWFESNQSNTQNSRVKDLFVPLSGALPSQIFVKAKHNADEVVLQLPISTTFKEVPWVETVDNVKPYYGPASGQTDVINVDGKMILEISADFSDVSKGGYAALVGDAISGPIELTNSIAFWMKGDNSGTAFSIRFNDRKGETFAYFLPDGVNWAGWRFVTLPLVNFPQHPSRHYGYEGDGKGEIAWPLRSTALEVGFLREKKVSLQILPKLFIQRSP